MTIGFKINSAKDNAANYSISTNMTTKIGAYQVAEDNAAMGLDLVGTAEGTLSQIQHDNLVSSRSTLRDADIAEVSAEYIQQQILQQASATLLATANQSPSIALQLI